MTPEDFQLVKKIYQESSDLTEREVDAYLASHFADRPDLAEEVRSLLSNRISEADFMVVDQESSPAGAASVVTSTYIRKSLASTSQAISWFSKILLDKRRRTVLFAVLILGLLTVGLVSRSTVSEEMLGIRGKELENVRNAKAHYLQNWISDELAEARLRMNDPSFSVAVNAVVDLATEENITVERIDSSSEKSVLEDFFELKKRSGGYAGGAVHDRDGYVVATFHADLQPWFQKRLSSFGIQYQTESFAGSGKAIYVPPTLDRELYSDFGTEDPGAIQGFLFPLRGSDGKFKSLVGVCYSADEQFSDILNIAEIGESGETYAIDGRGRMLSQSRFIEDLKNEKLVPDGGEHSMLKVFIRDPGGELRSGYSPDRSPEVWPLTQAAIEVIDANNRSASKSLDGVILEPYRNYRGIEVIGAWRWIPEYGFGIITEMELSEAMKPLNRLDDVFIAMYAVSLVLALIIICSSFSYIRLGKQLQESSRLGQYTLLKQIDEGGVGQIWTAKHQFLSRQTAVKIIKTDQKSADTIRRFDREAQLASQLKHPNTIQIYDYGQTDQGHYYYAMELLEGANLAKLIERGGPFPAGRCIHVLKQVCASLREAHLLGIVHRDVKPQNIMLCQHGDEYDFVKLLDFGLLKETQREDVESLTKHHQLSGTLMYMAPERIRTPAKVDFRCDLYAVGAVGCFLLTGKPCFEMHSDVDLIYQIIHEQAKIAGGLEEQNIPEQLEAFLLQCLSKNPEDRPESADACIHLLAGLERSFSWEQKDAKRIWAAESIGRI